VADESGAASLPAPAVRTDQPVIRPGELPRVEVQQEAPGQEPAPPGTVRLLSESLRQQNEELQQIREANKRLALELAQYGITLDAVSLFEMRLAVLMDRLWPMDTRRGQQAQMDYELAFEGRFSRMLLEGMTKVRQAQLGAGAQLTGPQIAELAREASLLEVPAARRRVRER
jgi:hypothetical protein